MGPALCGLYTKAGLPMPRLLFEAAVRPAGPVTLAPRGGRCG